MVCHLDRSCWCSLCGSQARAKTVNGLAMEWGGVGLSQEASALVVAATVLGAMTSFIDRIGQATQHQLH